MGSLSQSQSDSVFRSRPEMVLAGTWLVGGISSNKVSPSPSVKPEAVHEEMGMVDKLKAELEARVVAVEKGHAGNGTIFISLRVQG